MKNRLLLTLGIPLAFLNTGCARITTQVVEKPRVDQELMGNRGTLSGSAPEVGPRKTTRKMFQIDVDLATVDEMNPWRPAEEEEAASAVPQRDEAPEELKHKGAETDEDMTILMPEPEPMPEPMVEPEPELITYTVKKGDTLEKIAEHVYGDARQWRPIYEVNRDQLSSPDRVYEGQELLIPPGKAAFPEEAPEIK